MSISNYKGPIDPNEVCSITRDNLNEAKSVVKTSCGHLYTYEGLKYWLVTYRNDKCPMCHTKLDPRGLMTFTDKVYEKLYKIGDVALERFTDFCFSLQANPRIMIPINRTISIIGLSYLLISGNEQNIEYASVLYPTLDLTYEIFCKGYEYYLENYRL